MYVYLLTVDDVVKGDAGLTIPSEFTFDPRMPIFPG